ncbi:MAG: hypothetical protein ACXVB0_05790 [Mucilaginibacter sp.]
MTQKNSIAATNQWTFFTFLTAFSIYWTVNLILWFPWSYSTILGMTLMLTVSPLIWAIAIFQCLKRYQGEKLVKGAVLIALIYIVVAVIADYIFFGLIRHAIKDLYHPTTLYGYLFLISLPFILLFIFSKKLKHRQNIKRRELVIYGLLGTFSLLAITLIIKFNVTI